MGLEQELLERLLAIGYKMGKAPWCRCAIHQDAAYNILNQQGDYPQATMEETNAFVENYF